MSHPESIRQALIDEDCARIAGWMGSSWSALRGARILMTGGTGFVGTWMLAALVHANREQHLGVEVVVLTRNPARFRTRAPSIAGTVGVTLVEGDVRNFAEQPGAFSHVVHGATDTGVALNRDHPGEVIETVVGGTRRILEQAKGAGAGRFLFISSGAVYGSQPASMTGIPESHAGAPDTMNPLHAYHESKRMAELLCAIAGSTRPEMDVVIARLFAFVGPWLPLDAHFAVGNFLRDALAGTPIRIAGDGSAVRSYLYAADMAAWLWTLLIAGPVLTPVNVGSPEPLSIRALAEAAALAGGGIVPVHVEGRSGVPGGAYVPDTTRAAGLGLAAWTPLPEALHRTLRWHRAG